MKKNKLVQTLLISLLMITSMFLIFEVLYKNYFQMPEVEKVEEAVVEEENQEQEPQSVEIEKVPQQQVRQETPTPPTQKADEPFYVNGILVVNKQHALPASFAPGENPEAKQQLLKLITDAQAQGMNISNNYSGYRTYQYQESLYNGYIQTHGEAEANRFSAKPAHSEHQTGLAFDLIDWQGNLVESPAESQWILNNCAKYGFILRYPSGKENITGYQHEQWHLRYVGVDIATQIMNQGLTLEEYLGLA